MTCRGARSDHTRLQGCSSTQSHLSPLRPEGRIQLAVGQQAVLQAGEELKQMPSLREPQRRALDAILADQDHGAPTVYCWQEGGGGAGGEQREKQLWPMGAQGKAG